MWVHKRVQRQLVSFLVRPGCSISLWNVMNKDWVFQSYNQRWISKQALKMSKHNADSVIHGTIFIFYGSKMFFFSLILYVQKNRK